MGFVYYTKTTCFATGILNVSERGGAGMNVLVVCQYYAPEPFRVSDICEGLVRRGHTVTVITGTPNYPQGKAYTGYENGARADETVNGVCVHRCAIHLRKTGMFHRLWNYYSFARASTRYVRQLDDSFDVVLINQLSPVMMARAGIRYAKRHHKKAVLYCLDLWPASLSAVGVYRGPVYRWFRREAKKVYTAVDTILATSRNFGGYFKEQFGIEGVQHLPQYAEDVFTTEDCQKPADEYIDLMFAGNVGIVQSVETIVKAAAQCKHLSHVRWHIVGDGKQLDHCKQLAEQLQAPVIFHGRRPVAEMPRYYAMADAMLVTMRKDAALSLTLPGKVQTYMAAGKPILGAIDGETQQVVGEAACGYVVGAEDSTALAESAQKFASLSREERKKMQELSRVYYDEHYTVERFFNDLCCGLN